MHLKYNDFWYPESYPLHLEYNDFWYPEFYPFKVFEAFKVQGHSGYQKSLYFKCMG